MKAVLVIDIDDDTDLSNEADVIIDNGDFHLETKAFLKPMPKRYTSEYEYVIDTPTKRNAFRQGLAMGRNGLIDEILEGKINE